MVYPEEVEMKGQIAKLLYQVRIPVNVDKEDMITAEKLISHHIVREFKTPKIVFLKKGKEDLLALRTELESPLYLKHLLEVVSEGILIMESYLLTKSITSMNVQFSPYLSHQIFLLPKVFVPQLFSQPLLKNTLF